MAYNKDTYVYCYILYVSVCMHTHRKKKWDREDRQMWENGNSECVFVCTCRKKKRVNKCGTLTREC